MKGKVFLSENISERDVYTSRAEVEVMCDGMNDDDGKCRRIMLQQCHVELYINPANHAFGVNMAPPQWLL